jgi:hypothetical protein
MDRIKEFGESVREGVSNVKMPTPDDIRENAMNTVNKTMDAVDNVRDSVSSSLNQFSSQASVNADQSFLNSNSIIAKFAFVIFAVIVFIVLLYLGTKLVFYFYSPSLSPYIVKGVLAGNSNLTIYTTRKNDTNNVPILNSNNQPGGLEYTWSVWLYYNTITETTKHEPIFIKGNAVFDSTTNISGYNSPGLYFCLSGNSPFLITRYASNSHSIEGIPMKKWFHVAIRVQNTVLDIYVNGTIARREVFSSVPDENLYDILVGHSGGFNGNLSDLRYYSYALNIFDINNIILFGPNLSPSSLSPDSNNSNISYLSSNWYTSRMN